MEDLDRKESPINPYNRTEYPPVQWLPPDIEDTDTVMPSLEREPFTNSHMRMCFASPKDLLKKENTFTSGIRTEEDCKDEFARKEFYRKIRNKVEKAVKVIHKGILYLGYFR